MTSTVFTFPSELISFMKTQGVSGELVNSKAPNACLTASEVKLR